MSNKRKEKLAKRVHTPSQTSIGQTLKSLYRHPADCKEDLEMVTAVWQEHYGDLPEDFVPPFFEAAGDDGLKAADWVGTYRDLLLEKYGSLELVEPRLKFILNLMMTRTAR
jgi:hypothetical protein